MKFHTLLSAAALSSSAIAQDTHHNLTRPDSHASISIMSDHTHNQGEAMFSYRYMFMEMDGMYDGNNSVAASSVFSQGYVVSPTRMTMDMHMLGAMIAPTDKLTLSVMLPYTSMEMDHLIAPGAAPLIGLNNGNQRFTTSSSGIGDLKINSLIRLLHEEQHHLHVGFGVSLPIGSIAEKDVIPGPGGRLQRQLPAAMQMGSGTFDILPSLTYSYSAENWSAGVQSAAVLRLGRNHHGYTLGDQFDLTSWFAYKLTNWVSVSTGIAYRWENELDGVQADVALGVPFNPNVRTVPTAFGENYAGQRIEAMLGANFVIPGGFLENHRLAVDLRVPLWQHRSGLTLGVDYTASVGWQYAF